jgi:radical SAM protein with 4Fe4S-binding SPASM domain
MDKHNQRLDIKEMLDIGNWIEKELQKQISIQLLYSWPMAFHGIARLIKNQGEICMINNILGILSTGHLAMCGIGTQEDHLVYGQLGKEKINDLWINNQSLSEIREISTSSSLEGICHQCIHEDLCFGNCLAQNYYISKRLTAPFWFCQLADDNNLFPSSRKKKLQSIS